jgi:ABC-2 type transport system ATP-binding protein
MNPIFEAKHLTREFDGLRALDKLDLSIERGNVIGLIGRNGSGKTTLLNHICGLYLPTSGTCSTFGVDAAKLGGAELGRIGLVPQEIRLLGWMTVEQHLRYVEAASLHWDKQREDVLVHELELNRRDRVMKLTPGNLQKLAVVIAMCPKPELLLLDEPVSAMDPIARERLLEFLLELVREDETTVIVSSHVLRDIERVVNHVLCLERGRVCADIDLDDLLESYGEWTVTSRNGGLPAHFTEGYVLREERSESGARLVVRDAEADRGAFTARHHAEVTRRPLNLERVFPYLVGERKGSCVGRDES